MSITDAFAETFAAEFGTTTDAVSGANLPDLIYRARFGASGEGARGRLFEIVSRYECDSYASTLRAIAMCLSEPLGEIRARIKSNETNTDKTKENHQ